MTIMNREDKIVKLKLDIIFKRIFGNENNKEIIASFLSAMLDIPQESIRKIYIQNVELPPAILDKKFSRLDLRLEVDDRIINVELQVNYEEDFRERTLFYCSKLYSEQLGAGEEYGTLHQTFCINIINFNLFDCEDYHSNFVMMESNRHEVLTNRMAIHFFELKKVGKSKKKTAMEDWLNLINAETEGDLMDIQNTTTIPEVQRTIVMLRELSANEKVQREVYYREKQIHDEASALGTARREGIQEGIVLGKQEGIALGKQEGITLGRQEGSQAEKFNFAKKLLRIGMPISEIADLTELPLSTIEELAAKKSDTE